MKHKEEKPVKEKKSLGKRIRRWWDNSIVNLTIISIWKISKW